MTTPDVDTLHALSKVDFSALEQPYTDEELVPVMDQANAYIIQVTGRRFETMPPPLEPLAAEAVVLRAQQIVYRAQEDYAEGSNDDVVGSFSAGGYSETKHDPNRRGEARPINTNPELANLLWMLLAPFPGYPDDNVDTMYDYWTSLLGGSHAPAFEVTEVDWSGTGDMRLPSSLDDWGRWERLN